MTTFANENETEVPYLAKFLFSSECYEKVVLDFDILNGPCLQLLASKLIGYSIVVITSLFVKGPQVVKLLQAGSAEGISFLSILSSLINGTATVAWCTAQDYPFSTWGESVCLSLQNLLIGFLILWYGRKHTAIVIYLLLYVCGFSLLLSPLVPMSVHVFFQVLSVPLTASSKLLQIWANLRNGGTGQLSSISVFMMFFRGSGRLFTNLTETGDPYRITVYSVGTTLNTVLLAQVVYYYGKPIQKTKTR